MKDRDLATPYTCARYWLLHELRRIRAMLRVGNTTEPNARKERKFHQRQLMELRQYRDAPNRRRA